jgi:hypothetical protein
MWFRPQHSCRIARVNAATWQGAKFPTQMEGFSKNFDAGLDFRLR